MKQYSFIDMHIHTAFSDEELCDMPIEEVLAKAQKKAEKTGRDCVIAIADHNTILGVKRAREILNSPEGQQKYPNVKLINGIEFTTDLTELRDYFDGARVFTRCHTLAYGYDENDAELTAYSRITHKFFSVNDNVGMQICAARRIVCEVYGLDLPFTLFEHMADLPRSAKFKTEFLFTLKEYAEKHNLNLNIEEIDNLVSPYILNYVDYVRESASYGRLKVSDIAKLIKNAGGELVVAHPALIHVTTAGLQKIATQEGLALSDIYVPSDRKYNNNTDLLHIKRQKLILEYFIDAFDKSCGGGTSICGIEKYYSSHYDTRFDLVVESVCKERGLYETCGSDYHGLHLHRSKRLGNVFTPQIMATYRQISDPNNLSDTPMLVAGLTSVEHFLSDSPLHIQNQTIVADDSGNVVSQEIYEKVINQHTKRLKTSDGTTMPKIDDKPSLSFEERIAELTEVIDKFKKIIEQTESKAKQAKLLLRLNLFAENVYEPMRVLQVKSTQNYKIRQMPEYEHIYLMMAEIKNQFNSLLRYNPQIIKDLKKDMKYYYNKRSATINKLAELDFLPPIKPADEQAERR